MLFLYDVLGLERAKSWGKIEMRLGREKTEEQALQVPLCMGVSDDNLGAKKALEMGGETCGGIERIVRATHCPWLLF